MFQQQQFYLKGWPAWTLIITVPFISSEQEFNWDEMSHAACYSYPEIIQVYLECNFSACHFT